MKHFKKISFLSLTIGWIGIIICHIIWSNYRFENASSGDIGVVLFWSAFFILIYYGLFILIPQKRIAKLAEKRNLASFTLLSGIYATIGFTLIIGWLFIKSDFRIIFLDALVGGILFGLVFHILRNKYQNRLSRKHLIPILALPFFFLFIFLFAFPKLLPALSYKYVPIYVRHDILRRTIPQFKIGDELTDLQKALPGEFDFDGCSGNRGGSIESFQYVVEVNCCKIVRIEYGPRQKNGYSTGGIIKPCN